jgi:hypothetical protein
MERAKERHGCLTLLLMLYLVIYAFIAIGMASKPELFEEKFPTISRTTLWALAALAVLNIVFVAALFLWKRWAFYGFVVTNLAVFVLNLNAGLGFVNALSGLVGIPILFGVLRLGGEKSGWSQLE